MQVLSPNGTNAYTGVLRSTYRIASVEGIFSLWRGMSSVVVGAGERRHRLYAALLLTSSWSGPAHAVYFATYEAVKHAMGGNKAGVHHPLAAGMSCFLDLDQSCVYL
jgi:hypothetical protein